MERPHRIHYPPPFPPPENNVPSVFSLLQKEGNWVLSPLLYWTFHMFARKLHERNLSGCVVPNWERSLMPFVTSQRVDLKMEKEAKAKEQQCKDSKC